MIIAVDFDGTLVDHRFPDIGDDVPGAFEWLRKLQEAGAKLILWTMRSDGRKNDDGNVLSDAVNHCRLRGVEFFGVNANPEQSSWTDSPKVYAHVYVDDAAFGCPMRANPRYGGRHYVNWDVVGPYLLRRVEAAEAARSAG